MTEFYLVFEICMGVVCGAYQDNHDGQLATFPSAEVCAEHAVKEAPLINSNRVKATRYVCLPIKGA